MLEVLQIFYRYFVEVFSTAFAAVCCATVEFDGKDLVQDLNRLLQFAPGSQPNAAVLREFSNCA